MKCPKCGQELVCGCSACLVHFPAKENEKAMGFLPDGECQACPTCGFTQHADGWLDTKIAQLRAEGKWPLYKEGK